MYPLKSTNTKHYKLFGGINEKSSEYTTQPYQALRLSNLDFYVPNAWQKTPGYTQSTTNGSSGAIRSMVEFQRLDGSSFVVMSNDTAVARKVGTTGFTDIITGFNNNQPFDFVPFVNKLFAANGQTCISWDGTQVYPFAINCAPQPNITFASSASAVVGSSGFKHISGACNFAFFYNYIRGDGYNGPAQFDVNDRNRFCGTTLAGYVPATVTFYGITTPSNQGITAIGVYIWEGSGFTVPGPGFDATGTTQPSSLNNYRFLDFYSTGITAITIAWDEGGRYEDLTPGFTGMDFCFNHTFTPRYLDINQNSLVMSGFSASPSTLVISEVGEPEVIENPESFFEVRTNDSDRITGHKTYQNQTIVFKQRSFHKVIGSSFDNYQMVQLSSEYGCLSNKAIVEYDNILLFLDEKGIVRYDGASWNIISTPIEDTMRTLNVSAAIEMASAVHYKERNQVWFAIPVNGSTTNNLVVVYDYLLDAWTFIEGFNAASFSIMQNTLNQRTNWMGNYSGMINYFSPSFYSYNGTGITCAAHTAFDAPDGQDITNMFRRLFLDVNTVSGITGVVNVEVLRDYDRSTVKATTAIYQNQFQSRADFGVPGKAVGFKFFHNSPSLPFLINGYGVQRRYLRSV